MITIKTVKDIKEMVSVLPDDMLVYGCDSGGNNVPLGHIIISKDSLTEEEIRDGYPNGVIPKLIFFID